MVDAIQIVKDYCADEGFDYWTDKGGEWIEIFHFAGGAKVFRDGTVDSAVNFRLKAVLEKKIAQARAQEVQMDENGSCVVRFVSYYEKMPELLATRLLAVFKVREEELKTPFLEYDTKFLGKDEYFPLAKGEYKLILLMLTEEVPKPRLWTTVRPWEAEKERYYRSHVGEYVTLQAGGKGRGQDH